MVGLIALVLGWFAWSTIKRERARADELETRHNALQESVRTEFVPALTRATDALIRVAEVLPEMSPSPRRRS